MATSKKIAHVAAQAFKKVNHTSIKDRIKNLHTYLESQKIGEKRSIFEYFFRVHSSKQNENLGSHMLIQPYLQNFVTM